MVILPEDNLSRENNQHSKTYVCIPYDKKDLWSFWCARYENISFEKFMNLGYEEFLIKISSIPESEPMYTIIKSRTIDIKKIKNKEDRKYWEEQKRNNKIPDIYLPTEELKRELREKVKERGIKNVK